MPRKPSVIGIPSTFPSRIGVATPSQSQSWNPESDDQQVVDSLRILFPGSMDQSAKAKYRRGYQK